MVLTWADLSRICSQIPLTDLYRILTNIYSFFVFWKRSQIFNTTKLKKKKERKCDRKTLMMFAVAMKWWNTTTFCLLTPTSQMDEAENQLQLQQTERPIFSWVCFPKLEQEEACTYSHGNCPLIHVVVFWVTKSNCSQWLLAILNAEFESMLVRWVSIYASTACSPPFLCPSSSKTSWQICSVELF